MKRCLLIISITGSVLTSVYAQPQLAFDQDEIDFGTIVWKQPVTAKFTVTNTGDKPLVIHGVEASCGCVVSSWTKRAIPEHQTGTIEATFDARMLGHFNKSVAVYSNATEKPVYLSMVGVVGTEIVDDPLDYPYQIGEIRLDKNQIEFPDARKGDHPTIEIRVANGSSSNYEPVLMHLPSYMEAEATPKVLKPEESGIIRVTLNSEKMHAFGINRTHVYLSRFPGDKVGEDNQLDVISVLLPDFSELTARQRRMAPVIRLSATEIDLSKLDGKKTLLDLSKFGGKKISLDLDKLSGKKTLLDLSKLGGKKISLDLDKLSWLKTLKETVVITNEGSSTLTFEDVQVTHPALNISLKKQTLAPGKSTKMQVTLNTKYVGKTSLPATSRILIITNDPEHPKTEIKVTFTE